MPVPFDFTFYALIAGNVTLRCRLNQWRFKVPDINELKYEALSKLNEIVKQFRLPENKFETHAIAGSPKDQILKLADAINADLIIIASHRPDVSTYLLGSNAGAVVRHAKCPVLVVR